MEGSHGELVPVREALALPTDLAAWIIPVLLAAAGFVLVYAMDRAQRKLAPDHTLGG
jgi:hypothetical protein